MLFVDYQSQIDDTQNMDRTGHTTRKGHTMITVKLTDTGQTDTLSIIDPKTGIDWITDLLGNHGVYRNRDDGAVHMTSADCEWWQRYIDGQDRINEQLAELSADEVARFEQEFPGVDMEDEESAALALITEIVKERSRPEVSNVSDQTTCAIASGLINGADGFRDRDPLTLANELRSMNLDALRYRARHRPIGPEGGPITSFIVTIPLSDIALLKALHCLLYQCNEGEIPKCEFYQAIASICGDLANKIVMELPEYDKASWG